MLDAHDVKSRADFFSIASRYMRLRRAGRQFVGLCPFHSERHPSCYVHPEKKIFYCFGCNRGGDVFDFVMLAECCDFLKALRIVAKYSGVVSESEPRSGERFRASDPSVAKDRHHSPEERMFRVYVIECSTPFHFYVGASSDVDRRILQHRAGEAAKFTRVHGVRRVVSVGVPMPWPDAHEEEVRTYRVLKGRGRVVSVGHPGHGFSVERRAKILAKLDATDRRLALIAVTNAAASLALATACEPERSGGASFTCHKPDNSHG